MRYGNVSSTLSVLMTFFATPANGHLTDDATPDAGNDARSALLAEVDFKWLMAGEGLWVDMTRFQQDCSYATRFLRRAQASPCAALRDCARRLQARFESTDLKPAC
jgi:hypothetical protein